MDRLPSSSSSLNTNLIPSLFFLRHLVLVPQNSFFPVHTKSAITKHKKINLILDLFPHPHLTSHNCLPSACRRMPCAAVTLSILPHTASYNHHRPYFRQICSRCNFFSQRRFIANWIFQILIPLILVLYINVDRN